MQIGEMTVDVAPDVGGRRQLDMQLLVAFASALAADEEVLSRMSSINNP